MVWLRVGLCPVLLAGAWLGWPGPWLAVIVLVALIDDIYDGILARRWNCETVPLRRADSAADTVFYLGVATVLWMIDRPQIKQLWKLLLVLALLELGRHTFDQIKYRRAASYHSYLSKFWGLVLGIAVTAVLFTGRPLWILPIAVLLGIAADLEGLAMSLVLPRWQNNVKTLGAAWRLRRRMLEQMLP